MVQFVFSVARTCALTTARLDDFYTIYAEKHVDIDAYISYTPPYRERNPVARGSWQLSTPTYSVAGHGVVDRECDNMRYRLYTYVFITEYRQYEFWKCPRTTRSNNLFFFLFCLLKNVHGEPFVKMQGNCAPN